MKVLRLFDILFAVKENFPGRKLLAWRNFGRWVETDTEQYFQYSRNLAMAALRSGYRKGETFATIYRTNRPEWNFVDMGLMQLGMIHVPIHPGSAEETVRFILEKTSVRIVFIQDRHEWEMYGPLLQKIRTVKTILSFSRIQGVQHWKQWSQLSGNEQKRYSRILETARELVRPHDPATIVFTSGTTGQPKGVVLSHMNIVSNVLAAANLQPLGKDDRVLSFLPLSHIYERTSNYLFQLKGVEVFYAESYLHVKEDLLEVQPDGLTVVPRFLEKIEDSVENATHAIRGIKRHIYRKAMRLHLYYRSDHNNRLGFRIRQKFFDLVVFRKIRKKLGGKIRFIGCGGAPLSLLTEKFFWTLGLPVFQGYGLTETSPLITLNRPGNMHLGTTGSPLPGVKVKLDADNEILVKGPGVMKYYYRNAEETRKVFTADGWFRTGDLGKFIDSKYLKIIGRKKEMFKTSYGKYIVPSLIEGKLRRSPYINNAMVYGEGKKFPAAIIQPDFTVLRLQLKPGNDSPSETRKMLVTHPEVRKLISKEIEKINKTLDDHENIKSFHLVPDLWTVASGDLSASHKLKRAYLMNKYRKLIEKTYA